MVLSIAGLDPSAGAGLLADIKTFEQHKAYGLGICSAQTIQTENSFLSVRWEKEEDMLQAVNTMLSHYNVQAVKIGIIENISRLSKIVSFIHQKNAAIKTVVDTVIRSSSGFDFWNGRMNEEELHALLPKVFLITPNYEEAAKLVPGSDAKAAAQKLSAYCHVLLKGGHNTEEAGVDYLYLKNGGVERLQAGTDHISPKHGSGCVLSAAITAHLAAGTELVESCRQAKIYTEHFLNSNTTLLGYHYAS